MRYFLRDVAALGVLGGVTITTGLASHGCTNRLGPVQATQSAGGPNRPNLPDIFVEQTKECVVIDAPQMAPGRIVLHSTVDVNEDGDKQGTDIDGIPNTAPDFAACMRSALREMPIADQPFREAVNALKFQRKHANDSDDAFIEFLRTIPGVPMMATELVLDADGYSVALTVTVNVVANPESVIDDNNRTVGKLGTMALDTLGYDEIMKRAEQQGWVRKVRRDQQQPPAKKALVGDAATAVSEFGRIMGRGLVYAGISSQIDTPAPGIGDAIGVGIIAGALLIAGAIAVNELLTATATTTTTAQQCREAKEKCIDHCSGPAGLPAPGGGRFRACMRVCMESHGCSY